MIFETHAHYDDEAFDADRAELFESLQKAGIGRVVNVGASLQSCRATIELMERYPFLYGSLGIHPGETGGVSREDFSLLREMCAHKKCVAVGEIGLDYHWPEPERGVQKEWFVRQLSLARELGLPVIVHSRDAAKDTADIMREEKAREIGGVVHCYSYTKEMAGTFLDMGFFFGIGGVVTFKNAKKLKEAVEYLPMDRIVLETDSPYLAPEPYRGKRNDSRNLPLVVQEVSRIKGLDAARVEEITWENACRLYRMDQV